MHDIGMFLAGFASGMLAFWGVSIIAARWQAWEPRTRTEERMDAFLEVLESRDARDA